MKRALAIVALAVALPALAGSAGANVDLSLQDPPGAPAGAVLCLPAADLACSAPDVAGTAANVVEATPVVVPAVVAVDDAAYGARLHAELCAARPVFCEVDQSGHYIVP
ncbi:MAG: hypothetical protein ACRDZ3_02720 [Acidimicrobiia bacterium]